MDSKIRINAKPVIFHVNIPSIIRDKLSKAKSFLPQNAVKRQLHLEVATPNYNQI